MKSRAHFTNTHVVTVRYESELECNDAHFVELPSPLVIIPEVAEDLELVMKTPSTDYRGLLPDLHVKKGVCYELFLGVDYPTPTKLLLPNL